MTKPKYIQTTYYNGDEHLVEMIETRALTDLQEQCDSLEKALEMYEMTNKTFPEYGDVARVALAEYRKWKEE